MADVCVAGSELFADVARDDWRAYRIAKRVLDVTVASLAIVVCSPVLLLIALAIRLDSPGPAIFTQDRVGGRRTRRKDGHRWAIEAFTLYKFRTMESNSEDALHRDYMSAYLRGDEERLRALRPDRESGDTYRPASDPRVTPGGAFLRKLSLDELPQLWTWCGAK